MSDVRELTEERTQPPARVTGHGAGVGLPLRPAADRSAASAKPPTRKFLLILGGVAGLALIAGILLTVLKPADEFKVTRPLTVPIKRMPFASVLHELGTIEALSETPVLTRFAGDIVWKTEDGKAVEAGEPIVRFETKTAQEDVWQREKDLLDKRDAVRRAERDIVVTTERYKLVIRQAEIQQELAEIERKKIYEDPSEQDRVDAELTLKSATLELQKAEVEMKGYDELAQQGFVSEAARKKKQLEIATIRVNHSKAKLLYDLTLMGFSADSKRVADLAVADAKKKVNISKFNRDADLAVAKAALELARVDLHNFERELERKKRDLDAATVRAPIKGNVVFTEVSKGSLKIKSPIQVGESRTAGADLCTICDTSALRIRVWINEADVKGVALNQPATVTLPACPGMTLHAVVSELAVMAQDKNAALSSLALRKSGEAFVNVVPVRLDFMNLTEEQRRMIKVGFTAHVYLQTTERSEALTIPWAAVRYDEKSNPFAEVDAGGRRERRELKLGRNDGERVEVLDGLKEGEQVYDQTLSVRSLGGNRS
ncbi:MAG TPA: HlyD family efflux transporter periplasmic adaptor subunit [Planctomycetota bacterium]|nr:HlyD family efflux transporter periplasmic adaptor subunit [Planctomycetota bacterium]